MLHMVRHKIRRNIWCKFNDTWWSTFMIEKDILVKNLKNRLAFEKNTPV